MFAPTSFVAYVPYDTHVSQRVVRSRVFARHSVPASSSAHEENLAYAASRT